MLYFITSELCFPDNCIGVYSMLFLVKYILSFIMPICSHLGVGVGVCACMCMCACMCDMIFCCYTGDPSQRRCQ